MTWWHWRNCPAEERATSPSRLRIYPSSCRMSQTGGHALRRNQLLQSGARWSRRPWRSTPWCSPSPSRWELQELIQVQQSSVQASWDSQHPRPDLRLLVIEPHDLASATLAKLEEVGWGLCHVTVPPFMQRGTIPQYTLSYRWQSAVVLEKVPSEAVVATFNQ